MQASSLRAGLMLVIGSAIACGTSDKTGEAPGEGAADAARESAAVDQPTPDGAVSSPEDSSVGQAQEGGLVDGPGVTAGGRKPNILFILCDDLGYGDVGVFLQNQRPAGSMAHATPNIDRLASQGTMLRQHYSGAPVCVSSRTALVTGRHMGHAAVRDNQFDRSIPANHTIATVLKAGGYHTAVVGKWGMGGNASTPATGPLEGHPLNRGFDEFFGILAHDAGHVHYADAMHPLFDGVKDVTASYLTAYSTDLYTARAKDFISKHTMQQPDKPFFLLLTYTAPHNALQIPPGPYPAGGGAKGGLSWPLAAGGTPDSFLFPGYATATYDDDGDPKTAPVPWPANAKKYATMVRRIDDALADLQQLLVDLKIADNTLVVFTSDNGATLEGGADPRFFNSNGPFDGEKRDLWEGGFREPTIVWWPGHVPHATSDLPSAFYDWLPTMANFAGLATPAQSDGISLVPMLTGAAAAQRSRRYLYFEYQVATSNAFDQQVFARKNVTGRGDMQMVRIGDKVGVRYQIISHATPLRLYDVVADPFEATNLAARPENAALLAEMKDRLIDSRRPVKYIDPTSDIVRPYDDELLPASTVAGLTPGKLHYQAFEGDWPWIPQFRDLTSAKQGIADGLDASVATRATSTGLAFDGYLEVPTDGTYTFYLASDAGAHLWIHDAHVIDDDYNHVAGEAISSIALRAGRHPIRVDYRHLTGASTLKLSYSGPALTKQVVPAAAFSAPP